MSIGQIIVLAGIVGAFVLFALVLAWVDYRAQQQTKDDKKPAAASGTGKARWSQPSDDRLQRVA